MVDISTFFTNEITIVTSGLRSALHVSSQKGIILKGSTLRSKFSPFSVDLFSKGRQMNLLVASLNVNLLIIKSSLFLGHC